MSRERERERMPVEDIRDPERLAEMLQAVHDRAAGHDHDELDARDLADWTATRRHGMPDLVAEAELNRSHPALADKLLLSMPAANRDFQPEWCANRGMPKDGPTTVVVLNLACQPSLDPQREALVAQANRSTSNEVYALHRRGVSRHQWTDWRALVKSWADAERANNANLAKACALTWAVYRNMLKVREEMRAADIAKPA